MAHKYLFLLYPLVLHGVFFFFLQNSWINSIRGDFLDPGIRITIPKSCGILEGISDQSRGNCLELPPNWYENKDLLGFAIFYSYVQSEFEGYGWFLDIKGNGKQKLLGMFSLLSKPGLDSDILDLACIICYPKAAIMEMYLSNQWTHLVASFYSDARMEGFGIHLIYAKDYVQMPPSMVQASSSCGNSSINGTRKFFSHGNSRDDYSKAHNNRSPTEQSPVDESHHKRFRGTQD